MTKTKRASLFLLTQNFLQCVIKSQHLFMCMLYTHECTHTTNHNSIHSHSVLDNIHCEPKVAKKVELQTKRSANLENVGYFSLFDEQRKFHSRSLFWCLFSLSAIFGCLVVCDTTLWVFFFLISVQLNPKKKHHGINHNPIRQKSGWRLELTPHKRELYLVH